MLYEPENSQLLPWTEVNGEAGRRRIFLCPFTMSICAEKKISPSTSLACLLSVCLLLKSGNQQKERKGKSFLLLKCLKENKVFFSFVESISETLLWLPIHKGTWSEFANDDKEYTSSEIAEMFTISMKQFLREASQ